MVVAAGTAAGTAGKPISVGVQPDAIAFTPAGKLAYVLDQQGDLTPIDVATGTAGTPIEIADDPSLVVVAP